MRIGHIGLAIIAYLIYLAGFVGIPNLAAVHAQFTGEATQFSNVV